MRVQSPLKWHGGKTYLSPWIVSMMPKHTHYVEPYCGGCSVLFASGERFPDRSEVINDIDHWLMSFWWALQDKKDGPELIRRLQMTPFGRAEFDVAKEIVKSGSEGTTDVDRAYVFFVRNRQSLAGRGKDFAPLSRLRTRRGMNEQASAWVGAVDLLGLMIDRLRSVVVECLPALDVIRREDGPETLFYLDPPYLTSTVSSPDVYDHTMTEADHEALLAAITAPEIRGKVMLSGYPSKLYSSRLKGWRTEKLKIDNKASGGAVKDVVTETLWMNWR